MSTGNTKQARGPRTIPRRQGAAIEHHGGELARARVEAGLTQKAAAKLLEMSEIALSNIERSADELPRYKREGIAAVYGLCRKSSA